MIVVSVRGDSREGEWVIVVSVRGDSSECEM